MYRVIIRVHIDSPNGQRLAKLGILERIERLDLIVVGQLPPIPSPAERTDERHGGPEQIGLDGNEIDTCIERTDLRENEFEAVSQTTPIELHSQILSFERGSDGGVLSIDCDRQAVRQGQIVLDLAKGIEHRRTVEVFRLTIGRPGLLQLGATIPTLEDRHRNGGAIGPETSGQLDQIEAATLVPAAEPERHIGEKGGSGDADLTVRLRHPAFHPCDVGSTFKQGGWDSLWNLERGHSNIIDRFDLKTGRYRVDEDGDRLFRDLALALNLG